MKNMIKTGYSDVECMTALAAVVGDGGINRRPQDTFAA
jgi:hypothetical protein